MNKIALSAILALFGLTACFGQATDSNVVGVVIDASGATVPGASITVTNKDTGVKYAAVTNADGEYRLNNVPVGRYDVSAAKSGFTTATVAGVQLDLNHTSSIKLTLAVGSVSTTLEAMSVPLHKPSPPTSTAMTAGSRPRSGTPGTISRTSAPISSPSTTSLSSPWIPRKPSSPSRSSASATIIAARP